GPVGEGARRRPVHPFAESPGRVAAHRRGPGHHHPGSGSAAGRLPFARHAHEADFTRRYLGRDGSDIAWDMIRLAWSSVADYALAPLQDVFDLGTEARMNLPGRPSGNWSWRFTAEQLHDGVLGRLADLTGLYGRA